MINSIRVLLVTLCFVGGLLMPLTSHANTLPDASEFTQGMVAKSGFYRFYHDPASGNYYLAIPRPEQGDTSASLLLQTSLPRGLGSNDIGLDRGQLGNTQIVYFVVSDSKLILQAENTQITAMTTNAAERHSVTEAFASSVLWGFPVVAADAEQVIIDYTPYLISDTHGVSARLAATQQGSYKLSVERSMVYPANSKAFPDNTELEAKVTFVGQGQGQYVRQVAPDADALTVHLRHSLIRLPDDGFEPRRFHPNSGYWAISYKDYAAPLGQPMTQKFIPRHRLQKVDPDAARSAAVEPIVYYLDPGAPEPVRSALLDGAKWWNQAFHAIGYEDAFQVKMLPEDADPMDVRYNVIQWVHRATRGWSYGASIIDPRTGEILKGHVTLGSLRVRQDMKIAEGLLQPYNKDLTDAQQQQLRDQVTEMALARIRQLSAHEIGHTLGIAHNFAASGHDRASVMDYPHPLVELSTTGEGISLANAYATGMGVWDKQTIAYGYGSDSGTQSLATILRENKALGLAFISDRDARPAGGAHPDAHLWDNGSDAVTELERVLDVRSDVLARFGLGSIAAGTPVSDLQEVLVPIYALHRYQVEAAVKMLGGTHYQYFVKGEQQAAARNSIDFRPVNGRQQHLALKQILRSASADTLEIPDHIRKLLVPLSYGSDANRERFSGRTGLVPDPITMAEASANHSLSLVLHVQRLNRLRQQHEQDSAIPALNDVLSAMADTIIQPGLATNASVLQQRLAYLNLFLLAQSYGHSDLAPEVKAPIYRFFQDLQEETAAAEHDFARYLAKQLDAVVTSGKWPSDYQPAQLPPGSPI